MERLEDVEEACQRLYPRLFGALVLYGAGRDMAEDVAQETLVRLWVHWPSIRNRGRVDAWCYRTAMNLANSAVRRRRAEHRAKQRLRTTDVAADVDVADALSIRQALACLPERQRHALVLRFYAGLTIAESAAVLGCAPGTVKSHLHRALASLRAGGLVDVEVSSGA